MNFVSWDTTVLNALNGLAGHAPFNDAVIVFTASYLPYIVVAIFALHLYRKQQLTFSKKVQAMALAIGAALIARIGIGSPIRFFLPRVRPFITHHIPSLIVKNSPGFPSGHALFMFAFSTVVFGYNRTLGLACYFLTLLICLARVAAGIHYPSDILAGAMLGILCGYVCVRIGKHYRIVD